MADPETTTADTPVDQTPSETPEVQNEVPESTDPTEQRIDRIVAQRLGKYAARTREAEEKAERVITEYRERVARLEGQVSQQPKPEAPKQQFFTPEQLQAAVDQGRITPAQMASQISWQTQQQGNEQLLKTLAHQRRLDSAMAEVNEYMRKMPALGSTSSEEFRKVAAVAHDIADDMGLPVSDFRVQRRALRETFGSLDRITDTARVREFDRANADTHTATGNGGAPRPEPKKDPLAGIPPELKAHWDRLRYTQKMKEDEAVYYRQRQARKPSG